MGTRLSRILNLVKTSGDAALDTLIDGAITKIDTIDGNVDSILTDTGTTLDGLIDSLVAEFATGGAIPTLQAAVDELRSILVELHNDVNPTNPIT